MYRYVGLISILVFILSGCKGGGEKPTIENISPGMLKGEMVQRHGQGLVTGTGLNTHKSPPEKWERIAYRAGNEGLVVETIDGKVSKTYKVANRAPELAKRVKEGMSMKEVLEALGTPLNGYSPLNKSPDQSWVFGDSVAPIQTVTVSFKSGKVSNIKILDNAAIP